MLEFAGLRVGFGIGDGKCVGEEPLGKPAAADDVACAASAAIGQIDFGILYGDEAKNGETLNGALGVGIQRMETGEFGAPTDLGTEPEFFEDMIETRFVFGRINSDLRKATVSELDATVG